MEMRERTDEECNNILYILDVIPVQTGIHVFQWVTFNVDPPVKPEDDKFQTFSATC
jgi:hypothetical protein